MKRIIIFAAALLCAASCFALSGCSASKQCEPDELLDAVEAADKVDACIYDDGDVMLELDAGRELRELMNGDWQKADGRPNGKKVVSVTVATQYEVCFFDDGAAMIYYGYCGVFQKDRQYYKVTLKGELDELVEYIRENGTEIEDEETTSAD